MGRNWSANNCIFTRREAPNLYACLSILNGVVFCWFLVIFRRQVWVEWQWSSTYFPAFDGYSPSPTNWHKMMGLLSSTMFYELIRQLIFPKPDDFQNESIKSASILFVYPVAHHIPSRRRAFVWSSFIYPVFFSSQRLTLFSLLLNCFKWPRTTNRRPRESTFLSVWFCYKLSNYLDKSRSNFYVFSVIPPFCERHHTILSINRHLSRILYYEWVA